jgi:hypothetical protein
MPSKPSAHIHRGACLCGRIHFEIEGPLANPDACHCDDCRKHSGHCFASTDIPKAALTLHGREHLTWYASSEKVRRGFCSICGSSLFGDPHERDWIAVAMGAFVSPTRTQLEKHLWVSDQADYYEIAVGLPQNAQ